MDLALLIVTAVILVGAAATFRLWGAPLLPRLGAGPDVIRGLGCFFQLSLWLAALATVVLLASSLALEAISIRFGWFNGGGPPESAGGRHPVLDTFPFYEGVSWTYTYTEETEQGVETGVITDTVTMVPAGSDEVYLAGSLWSGGPSSVTVRRTASQGVSRRTGSSRMHPASTSPVREMRRTLSQRS